MKKSQRPRNRYISFKVLDPVPNIENKLFQEFIKFFGTQRYNTGFKVIQFDSIKGKGIIRCKRGLEKKFREFLNTTSIKLKTIKTSGTLKALRRVSDLTKPKKII